MSPASRLVTVSAYGESGSSARVRIFDWLRRVGVDAHRSTYLGRPDNRVSALVREVPGIIRAEQDLRRLAKVVDDATVLLSREASPFSFGAIEQKLLRTAHRGVYDFDDALYLGYPGGLLARARHIDLVWRRSVEAADLVIAGNEVLADRAAEYATEVVMIPSCIEPADYLPKGSYLVGETPTIAWLGSPSTEKQLRRVSQPLLALHRRLGARLTLISAGQQSLGELDVMVDRVPWTADGFATALGVADVGIMPLEDDDWNRGKCAYKLLQYAAAGLPVVGSPVGVNVTVLEKLGGAAARTPQEWEDSLDAILRADEAARSRAGRAALLGVTEHYSFGSWERSWRLATGL